MWLVRSVQGSTWLRVQGLGFRVALVVGALVEKLLPPLGHIHLAMGRPWISFRGRQGETVGDGGRQGETWGDRGDAAGETGGRQGEYPDARAPPWPHCLPVRGQHPPPRAPPPRPPLLLLLLLVLLLLVVV